MAVEAIRFDELPVISEVVVSHRHKLLAAHIMGYVNVQFIHHPYFLTEVW